MKLNETRRIGAIFGMLSRRAVLSATAGLYCLSLTVNISRTVADTTKVTINDKYEVTYGLSIGTKMDDLG